MPAKPTRWLVCLAVSLLMMVSGLAADAEPDTDADKPAREGRGLGRLALSQAYIAPADFDDFGGDVSIRSSALNLNVAMFSAGYSYHAFAWDGTARLPFSDGGDPWQQLQSWKVGGRFGKKLSDQMRLQFIVGLSSAFERQTSSSLAWNTGAMLAWPFGDDWNFAFGLMVRGHEAVDVDYPVLPAVGISWRRRQLGWSAGLGFPKTEVRYSWHRQFSMALDAGFTLGNTFRLADDSPVVPGGYAKFSGFSLGITGRWQVFPKANVTWGIGWVGNQELELYDDDGDDLADYDLDRTWSTRLGLSYRF